MVKMVNCDSAGEILQALSDLCEPSPKDDSARDVWLFRGQADSKWPLTSSLERDPRLKPFWESEEAMLGLFRSKAHLYSDLPKAGLGTLDLLSIMQHNGAPTRLLDWTYSPSVAVFFSAADEPEPEATSRAVWAVNQSKVRWWSNYVYQTKFRHYNPPEQTDLHFTIENQEVDFSDEEIWSILRLEPNMCSMTGGFVTALLPKFHNPRLVNQQGVFLANLRLDMPFQESLEDMLKDTNEPAIVKFVFPSQIRDSLLLKLMTANVHHGVLFPDLHGLCSFIRSYRILHPENSVNRIRS